MIAQQTDPWLMLYTDAGEFPLPDSYAEGARRVGIVVELVDGHDPDRIAAYGARCDGLFVFRARVDDALLAALPRCRLVARIGTGYDLIDVEAARRRDVLVTYVPDFCTEELSDHVLACILGFGRQFPAILWQARAHRWLSADAVPMPHRLRGRTLGILGFGRSGQRTAEKARAFGIEVLVWTRTPKPDAVSRAGARVASFEQALGCDYVSLHLPLTDATRGLIGTAALAQASPGTVLINIARGAVVDTGALVEALQAGRLAGAALDVVQPAPLPPEHPLWSLPNVWITSHSAAFSHEAKDEALSTAFGDAALVRAGRPPLYPVPELQMPVAQVVPTEDLDPAAAVWAPGRPPPAPGHDRATHAGTGTADRAEPQPIVSAGMPGRMLPALNQSCFPGLSTARFLDLAATVGAAAVELRLSGRESASQIAAAVRASGMPVVAVNPLMDWGLPDDPDPRPALVTLLEVAVAVGATLTVCVAPIRADGLPDRDAVMSSAIGRLALMAPLARRAGVKLALEQVGRSSTRPGAVSGIRSLRDALAIAEAASEDVVLVADSYNLASAGVPYDDLRAIPPSRIGIAHLTDAISAQHFRVLPGEGDLLLESFVRALAAAGYAGVLSLELFPTAPWDEPLAFARQAMASIARCLAWAGT